MYVCNTPSALPIAAIKDKRAELIICSADDLRGIDVAILASCTS